MSKCFIYEAAMKVIIGSRATVSRLEAGAERNGAKHGPSIGAAAVTTNAGGSSPEAAFHITAAMALECTAGTPPVRWRKILY